AIVTTPVQTDSDQCTQLTCDPMNGATFGPVDANDNNACTNDSCDTTLGIRHTTVDPNDFNVCTTDSCDPVLGVQNVTKAAVLAEDFADNNAGWTLGLEWQIGP